MKNENIEEKMKKCCIPWCDRIVSEDEKLGMCPECVNRYGSLLITGGMVTVITNRNKIIKGAGKTLKVIMRTIKH